MKLEELPLLHLLPPVAFCSLFLRGGAGGAPATASSTAAEGFCFLLELEEPILHMLRPLPIALFFKIGRKGTGPCVKPVAPKSSKVIASSSSSENYRRGKLRPKTIVHSFPAPKQGVTSKQLMGLTAVRAFTL